MFNVKLVTRKPIHNHFRGYLEERLTVGLILMIKKAVQTLSLTKT